MRGCDIASCTRREPACGFFLACSGNGTESSMCFHSSEARKNRLKACLKISACSWRLTKIASNVVKTSARLPMSITWRALMASMTAPGPTGMPAERSARAKPTMLSANCSVCSGARWLMAMVRHSQPSFRVAASWARAGRIHSVYSLCGTMDSEFALRAPRNDKLVARRVLQYLLQGVALHPRDVVLVFEQRAQRVADHLRGQRAGVELRQRGGPVDGLGDARRLVEILIAERLDETHDLLRQFCGDAGHARLDDRELAIRVRIIDPVIETTPLQRVVDLAGAVGGDDDDRRARRLHGAEFGDRHLEVAEDFEQIGLERLVGAVELVDQQHRRPGDVRLQRLEQRSLDHVAIGENVGRQLIAIGISGGLGHPDRDHLRGAIPLVDRRGDVEAFVTLQAD